MLYYNYLYVRVAGDSCLNNLRGYVYGSLIGT